LRGIEKGNEKFISNRRRRPSTLIAINKSFFLEMIYIVLAFLSVVQSIGD
jgi:hypothetical protein